MILSRQQQKDVNKLITNAINGNLVSLNKVINKTMFVTQKISVVHTAGQWTQGAFNEKGDIFNNIAISVIGGVFVGTPPMTDYYHPAVKGGVPIPTTLVGIKFATNAVITDFTSHSAQFDIGLFQQAQTALVQNTVPGYGIEIDAWLKNMVTGNTPYSDMALISYMPNSGVRVCNNGIALSNSPVIGEDGTLYGIYDLSSYDLQIGKGSTTICPINNAINVPTYLQRPYHNLFTFGLHPDLISKTYDIEVTLEYYY